MGTYRLGEMERRFADILWERAPIRTRDLVEVCAEAFDWKRTTTYTMLKRLCKRGLFRNDKGTVVVVMGKEDFLAEKGGEFLEESFEGSLPRFLAAFARRKQLSEKEIEEIQRLIDAHKREG